MSVLPTEAATAANPTTSPNPAPQPAPEAPPAAAVRHRRSGLHADQQAEITKAREVLAAARQPGRAELLAARRNVTSGELDALDAAIDHAEAAGAATEGARPRRKASTLREAAIRQDLLRCLREIQTAARRVWQRSDPARLEAYKIGENLSASRALLEGFATNLIRQGLANDLPGWPADSRAAAQECLDRYQAAQGQQSTAGSEAESLTRTRDEAVAEVVNLRGDLQLAAENEWPAGNASNAAIRREFKLPPHRPFHR